MVVELRANPLAIPHFEMAGRFQNHPAVSIARAEKGDRSNLCEAPGTGPFFGVKMYFLRRP
jgi:hypothetical protein